MTSYITITDAETDPEAPLTSELAKKWRDNPLAIAEGDATAPRIFGEAMARPDNGLTVLTVSAANTYTLGVGLTIVEGDLSNGAITNANASTITVKNFSGTIRFKASHQTSGGSFTSTLEIYKNNVLVTSFATQSTTPVARTADVSVAVNDVIEWRHRTNAAGSPSTVSALSQTASNAWVEQPAYRRATS